MKAFVQRSVFVLLTLVAAQGDGLRGQWKIVAPNAFILPQAGQQAGGAVHYKDGIMWAGGSALIFSTDTGKSWANATSPFTLVGDWILDIAFLDKNTGIVSTQRSGLFITHDRAQTWSRIASNQCFRILFSRSGNSIYALAGSDFIVSKDEGLSWVTSFTNGSTGLTFAEAVDGSIYLPTVGVGGGFDGFIQVSKDTGKSWESRPSGFYFDAYAIDIDSCDPARVYISDENFINSGNGFSSEYVSTNTGQSWTATFAKPTHYLVGSIANSGHALYSGTLLDGIIRSTDMGSSWISIGGPNSPFDCRGIATVNDNIVFAIDSEGNVWSTFNSGGDSILASSYQPAFSASPSILFSTDRITCDSISRTIMFTRGSCYPKPDSVKDWMIIGLDSASFKTSNLSSDSILVTLYGIGATPGYQHAKLVLFLNNGSSDTVALAGYVNTSASTLSLSTQNAQTDTLGATVSVPISITGLSHPENINLILHYDTTLQYQGSFDAANVKLDIPGQQWPGRSVLNIAQAQSGVVAGYARFTVFADSGTKPQVTFDSLEVLSASSPCEYTLPAAVTSTITPPTGCGAIILSEFLRDGQIPTFTVRPNPTMGDVAITSSLDIGDAEIGIFDMLGIERSDITLSLAKDEPVNISMPESAGIYYLRVKSDAGISNMSVVVSK